MNIIELTKQHYPKGTRIQLIEMGEDPHPIPSGTKGTVEFVDDMGQIHMKWDNSRSLALVPSEDRFIKIEEV